ncbi:sulfite reductase subunit alpha [Methylacidiphilum kamchatkense Kam1]|uniref:assimilatory sulfite reductase (NADPH) n=1 Tax=Methylacidiphilum kamchatkense Kam1 TaxID=1202785 RepID=A0A0C1V5G0_9BACT|nr:flavodoxin domain-containing protein [Methylacidiphilum kamchatkense]KIE58975.1 sulfite reductase subunit alpha [Methylacidiphilum kamchatkense Kam1]QDQ43140.1 sulfite reductase (NADPH) flavoprotein alpha-component [Methylacidiphilum kamchatkense Kam1]
MEGSLELVPKENIRKLPETAPLSLVEKAWISGFLAGIMEYAEAGRPFPSIPKWAPISPVARQWAEEFIFNLLSFPQTELQKEGESSRTNHLTIKIFFGSQTGNAEELAKRMGRKLQSVKFPVSVIDLADFKSVDLTKESYAIFFISTFGEGEPPDNAREFWEYLSSSEAPRLENLQYALLALGDSAYPDFCQAGKNVDKRLEELGAKRIYPRVDCDVDYEESASKWIDSVLEILPRSLQISDQNEQALSVETKGEGQKVSVPLTPKKVSVPQPPFNKQNPFPSRVLENRRLTLMGSEKETRHLELSLEGSDLSYLPGDAVGVFPTNWPVLVQEIIETLGYTGEEIVPTPSGENVPLREALYRHYEINSILDDFPKKGIGALELVKNLRSLSPRYYSIACSPKLYEMEVHLTVVVVRYIQHGRWRRGICSNFLAEASPKVPIPIFIRSNPNFRIPSDPDTPMIMIGPGTGIAPFRAFLQERMAIGAKGKNWLFFGEQHRATDFFYQEELEDFLKKGVLTRLDTAFSRDQSYKIYVQHRMLENAQDFWSWLQEGAYVYVCGDAHRMAKDVDAALHRICETAGGLSKEKAQEYVQNLRSTKRYLRDVY